MWALVRRGAGTMGRPTWARGAGTMFACTVDGRGGDVGWGTQWLGSSCDASTWEAEKKKSVWGGGGGEDDTCDKAVHVIYA